MLTMLFFFPDYTHYSVLLHYYLNEISDYVHYSVLFSLQLKRNL